MALHFRPSKELFVFVIVGFLLIAAYYWFMNSPYFAAVNSWARNNFYLYFLFITLIKLIGILYPPLAGGLVTLGSVPIIGWESAFIADFIGTTLGGSLNYWIGRRFGLTVVKKLVGPETANQVEKIKFRKGREIEGIIAARIFFGAVMLEVIHYAAGIFRINFKKYLIGLVISHLMIWIPIFYFFSDIVTSGNLWMAAIPILVAFPLMYKFRRRYFDI